MEAKHFTEMATLNREVRILLQGVDKHENVIGSVMYPAASQGSTDLEDLGLQLVERGFAKVRMNCHTPLDVRHVRRMHADS